MRSGRLALPWLLGAWLLLPSVALGQDRLARTHYEAGSSYYQQGRYQESLREFEEAYRLSSAGRKPALLYNIGLAHERLGHIAEAIDSLRRYLEGTPNADDAEIVAERIRTLQSRLDATGIALEVSEEGARVMVDGEERGTTPLAEPLRVAAGSHELRVEKEGFQPFSLRVSVPAGEQVSVEANLVALAAPPPGRGHQGPIGREPIRPESGGAGPLPWVLIGIGGAAAIGGGIFGAMALRNRDEANDSVTADRARYDDAKTTAQRTALLADISFGVAVAAVATGFILLVTSGASDDEEAGSAADPVLTPVAFSGGAGVVLAGSL